MMRLLIASAMLAGMVGTDAAAQDTGSKTGVLAKPECVESTATRARSNSNCNQSTQQLVLRGEMTMTATLDPLEPSVKTCAANVALEFLQNNTVAHYEGELVNRTCGASSGEYTIEIRTRDDSGEMTVQKFTETWQRDNDQPIKIVGDRDIAADVDLIRVKARKVRCVCADDDSMAVDPAPPADLEVN